MPTKKKTKAVPKTKTAYIALGFDKYDSYLATTEPANSKAEAIKWAGYNDIDVVTVLEIPYNTQTAKAVNVPSIKLGVINA